MKILVTGGAGFIGATLCGALVRRGIDVVVLDDLSTGRRAHLDDLDVDLRVGSVLDGAAVADACAGADSVVHLAAVPSVARSLADPRRSHDVNVTGTLEVLEAARATGAHVVLASSSSVYGQNPALPKSEGMTCLPMSPYAAGKLAAESYTSSYRHCFGMRGIVFRFFNVFGPLQLPDNAYAAVIPAFVWAALHGETLVVHGDGEQSRDFTFVDSVVEVLAESAVQAVDSGCPVNLAFGTRTSVNDVIALLSAVFGRRLDVVHQPSRAGDVRHSQASAVVLRRLFPLVEPVPLDVALRRTVEWMESQAWTTDLASGTRP
jgi:UDP-glucose 4-epimerase